MGYRPFRNSGQLLLKGENIAHGRRVRKLSTIARVRSSILMQTSSAHTPLLRVNWRSGSGVASARLLFMSDTSSASNASSNGWFRTIFEVHGSFSIRAGKERNLNKNEKRTCDSESASDINSEGHCHKLARRAYQESLWKHCILFRSLAARTSHLISVPQNILCDRLIHESRQSINTIEN